ncbi:MAG TPA: AAA family ATPase [Burkholderiales bacterium]|nr:AAA family ATPase [Burkholderiales bacterium]
MPKTTVPPLDVEHLYNRCDPADLNFQTTAELPDMEGVFGQDRAADAIRFGLAIERPGYNLYVLGEHGGGRHWLVKRLLGEAADKAQIPDDWVYVNNFEEARKPIALRLPAGRGMTLRNDMQKLVSELAPAISAGFESDQYRQQVDAIQEELKKKQESALQGLGDEAAKNGIALVRTPHGFTFAPVKDDQPIGPDEFAKLPKQDQARISEKISELSEKLTEVMQEAPRWHRETMTRVNEVSRETLGLAVGHLVAEVKERYADLPAVVTYLDAVLKDLVESGQQLHEQPHQESDPDTQSMTGTISLQRYLVNLFIDNSRLEGAPVIYEDNPTHHYLVGRVDQIAQMGTLVTNFLMVKAGSLHRANGGYLIIDAAKVLTQPYAWEGLKRALRAHQIQIESLGQVYGLINTLSLEPEPIPIKLKVVLIGERLLYYMLSSYDPDFQELFKVEADFESDIPRNGGNTRLYAQLIATLSRVNEIKPLDKAAVGRVIEHASRLVDDSQKMTTHVRRITDLLREAEHFAQRDEREVISRHDIEEALHAQLYRTDRVKRRTQQAILEDILLIDTSGERPGQINGLAATTLGEATFAHPVRITATVRLGEGDVIDIEREVELGGAIHSKGVMILSSFLGARYSRGMPLALNASLVFEQSYGPVEGDSASLAELCALLSVLADTPIRQSLAVTGSVNQHGQVQAIGAVNHKIEGFFDICTARGLTGDQGVLIPGANVRHLMLREDVVEAAIAGKFHIYAVSNVDEAIELLTGVPAGVPDDQGIIPEGSINYLVASEIAEMSARRQSFNQPAAKNHQED